MHIEHACIFACVICICTQRFGVHSRLVRAVRVCKYQLTGRIHREPHIMARCKSVEMKPCLLQTTQHPAPSTQHPHPHPHPHPHAHSIHKHTALNQSEKAEKHTDSDRERERRETRDGGRERGRRSKTQTLADVFPTVSLSVFPLSSLTHLYALGVINGFHFRLVDKRRTSIRSHRSRTTT